MSVSPHAQTARTALAQLKELASSLEGWNFSQEKDGVKLYNKSADNSPVPIVRGDILLTGHEFTPQQIASIATLPGARKIWDEKFDVAELKQMYSAYESLFWCKVKTPWPISARDMSATSLREISEDECYVVMTSVEDESVPLVSGNVRANLFIPGWKLSNKMSVLPLLTLLKSIWLVPFLLLLSRIFNNKFPCVLVKSSSTLKITVSLPLPLLAPPCSS
ncbi:unnamed protein product [Mucor hiemalis]